MAFTLWLCCVPLRYLSCFWCSTLLRQAAAAEQLLPSCSSRALMSTEVGGGAGPARGAAVNAGVV